jgi:FAD:protein FMN transferase
MEWKGTELGQERTFDRRAFLKLSGLLGAGVATFALLPAAAEAVKFDRKRHKISSTRLALGTVVSMTLIHESRDRAQEAMGRAFEEMNRLSGILNRYDSVTAVGLLNHEGHLTDAPPEVCKVVSRAMHHYRLTGGAFDITVQPVVDLFKQRYETPGPLTVHEDEMERMLKLVDARGIVLGPREIRFSRAGMGVTLDGIAKGYIVDCASELLERMGVLNHLVNAGGDIRTRGERSDGKPWSVAIQDPDKQGNYPDVIRMRNGAVATSGNYEVYFDQEKMVHHIVDPESGHSPRLHASVSVRAGTAMDADALATGVFVMNPARGLRLIEGLTGCDTFVIERSGRTWKSAGWKSAAR